MSVIQVCKNHVWRELESNELGEPTKYKCINCLLEFRVKKDTTPKDYHERYFDRKNSILCKIAENEQKIAIIKLHSVGLGEEKLFIDHLSRENAKLRMFL